MPKVVIYARYSSSNQREESIEDQVRVCRQEAERRGDEVVGIYADKATTGTSAEHRAEFLRMVSDAAKGGFEAVYVYKVDRFSRNRMDFAVYKARLARHGVRVEPIAERLPDGPEAIIMESLLEGLAEYYSANLSQNVKRGMEGNALKCMHNGAQLYGYDLGADGFYHVNKQEAEVVRGIFEAYAGGAAMPAIAESLSGVRTRGGKSFGTSYLARMLRNEKYAGTYVFKGHRVPGGMEAIVDRPVFDAVQKRLSGARHRRKPRGEREPYRLTGKLFDEDGNRFVGYSGTSHTGDTHRYYKCMETGRTIRKEAAEAAVEELVSEFLGADPGLRDEICDMVLGAQERAMSGEIAARRSLEERIEAVRRERVRLVDLAAQTGEIGEIAAKLDATGAELAAMERDLAELEKGSPVLNRDMVMYFLEQVRLCKAPAILCEGFVNRLVLRSDRTLTAEFVLADRTPESAETGVLMENSWLTSREYIRTFGRLRLYPIPGGFAVELAA